MIYEYRWKSTGKVLGYYSSPDYAFDIFDVIPLVYK